MVAVAEPEAPIVQVPDRVYAVLLPAHVRVIAATDPLPVPVFVRVR